MEENAVLEARATLKYARISARKVKIVADLIRGKNVDEALAIVKYVPKASSEIIEKLLKSAIANAENNHHMAHEKLYVAEIYFVASMYCFCGLPNCYFLFVKTAINR